MVDPPRYVGAARSPLGRARTLHDGMPFGMGRPIQPEVDRGRTMNAAAPPSSQHRPRRCNATPNDAAFQQRTARGGRAPLAQPGCAPRARRAGKAGGWPAGPVPTGHIARPSAWSSRSANRDRVAGQRCQRPRRRITPNTNTSTTTMISTHNHVDIAAPWSAQGQFTATLLPPTRAGNSVTARRTLWARIDGRAAHGLAGALHPATCPPIWARRAPCRRPPRVHPGGAEPFGPRPGQLLHPTPHGRRTRAGVNRPHPATARPTGGCSEAERSLPWVGRERCEHGDAEAHWQTPRRRWRNRQELWIADSA